MLYDQLISRSKEIDDLIKLGLIDPTWKRNIRIYSDFVKLRDSGLNINSCYVILSENEGISWGSVKLIVKKLGSS